uniref:Uncharacterized protein n=1 Tax=Panagrolaimus sp. PS1159 TaxID=55785 RepID=A0AC35FZZ5_9BILA
MKLTPEYKAKVQASRYAVNSFDKCNHKNWYSTTTEISGIIDTNRCFYNLEYGRIFFETFNSTTSDASNGCNIDRVEINRCFNNLEYGRIFFETFNSTTSDASNGCNIDRVEIHPCYTKTGENDPMNIFWGSIDPDFEFICNGSVPYLLPESDSLNYNLWSFNPPAKKYAMLDEGKLKDLTNRIVSSTAFFYQCPKCTFMHRFHPINDNRTDVTQFFLKETAPSIPRGAAKCYPVWDVYCDFNSNPLIQTSEKTFSQKVLPFTIVMDSSFVC